MRKKGTLFAAALITGTILTAFSMNAYGAQITEDDAKTIALDDAGLTEEDVISIRVTADKDDGRQIQEVSFITQSHEEYEYEILTENGLIYGTSYDYEMASEGPGATTLEQAQQIAAEHAGELTDEVTFTQTRTEKDDGRTIHELEFRTQDEKEFDYEIDADTGAILCWDYDGKYHLSWMKENQQQETTAAEETPAPAPQQNSPASGLEAVKAAALERAGLGEADVTWGRVHEDYEDGRLVYEGKFFCGTDEYEFEADAATGEIISWEMDSIFD